MTVDRSPSELQSIRALGDELARAAAAESRRPHRRGVAVRRLAPALGVALALTGLAFTPPGRAVAEEIGRFVGLVENDGSVVIGLGGSPQELHPYVVTVNGNSSPGETCVFVEFDEFPAAAQGSCLAGDVPRDLAREKLSPLVYAPPERMLSPGSAVLQVLAVPGVDRLQVSYGESGNRTELAVSDSDLSVNLLRKGGLTDEPARFFLAFVPPEALEGASSSESGASLPRVHLRASGPSGETVAERTLTDLREYEADLRLQP